MLWLSVFTSLVFRYCTVFGVKPWPNVPVISVLKPTGSPLWKLWRRLHNQPVTFTASNRSDSYLAVASRSSKSLDKIDLLMQTWWIIDWILRLLATLIFLGGILTEDFFEQAAINICSGSIPNREFTKPAANRFPKTPNTPKYWGYPPVLWGTCSKTCFLEPCTPATVEEPVQSR